MSDEELSEFAASNSAGVQAIRFDGSVLTIRTWVTTGEYAEHLAGELGEPTGEYMAPATAEGFTNRVEL